MWSRSSAQPVAIACQWSPSAPAPASVAQLPLAINKAEADHHVFDFAEAGGVLASRAGGEIAADGAAADGGGEVAEREAVALEFMLEPLPDPAGADADESISRARKVEVEEPLGVERDATFEGHSCAADAGAGAEGDHGQAVATRGAHHLDHICNRAGMNDEVGRRDGPLPCSGLQREPRPRVARIEQFCGR